jgi:alkylation response protein AidB-like acyl-CoA dehydrogenase
MAVLTEEQSMLRDAARTWTQEKSPVSAFRKMRDSGAPLGYDPAAFAEMAEMGWTGVIIPEEYGGSDFGYLSLGLVLEETGRTLTASPLLSTALAAASALILGGSAAQKEAWLPKIAAGELVGTLADRRRPAPRAGKGRAGGDQVRRRLQPLGQPRPSCSKAWPPACSWSRPAPRASRATRTGSPSSWSRRRQGRQPQGAEAGRQPRRGVVSFENVEVGADAVLGEEGKGWDLLEKVLDRARAGLAAEMLGSASRRSRPRSTT